MPESAKPGAKVGNIKPDDGYLENSSGTWYSIISGNRDNRFDIDSWTGDLVVVRALDADIRAEYNLKVGLNDNVYGMAREVLKVGENYFLQAKF